MKTIKLIIIFTVILGGIIGVLWLINPDKNNLLPIFPDDETYETYRKQFEDDWEQKNDWDKSLFDDHCELIRQLSTQYETTPLKDLNTSRAIEVVYNKVFAEWKSATCRKNVIKNYIEAIGIIERQDANASKLKNMVKIKEVNETYEKVYEFAHKKIGLTPLFDSDRSLWNSYDRYSEKIIAQKEEISQNPNYKEYLANISDIKDGLTAIPDKLKQGRSAFYTSLAKMIEEHYKKISPSTRTRDQYNNLRNARNKYETEYSSNENLNKFCQAFQKDVEQNELLAKIIKFCEDTPRSERTREQLEQLQSYKNEYEKKFSFNRDLNSIVDSFQKDVEQNENDRNI